MLQLASLDGLAFYFDTDASSIYQEGDRRGEMMKSFQSLVSTAFIDYKGLSVEADPSSIATTDCKQGSRRPAPIHPETCQRRVENHHEKEAIERGR